MDYYQPLAVKLYKRVTCDPMKLKITFDLKVEALKKVFKSPSTDPLILNTATYVRYDIGADTTKDSDYYPPFVEEFDWSGEIINVEIAINGGGHAVVSSDKAEPY